MKEISETSPSPPRVDGSAHRKPSRTGLPEVATLNLRRFPRLVFLLGVILLTACSPRQASDPTPRTAAEAIASPVLEQSSQPAVAVGPPETTQPDLSPTAVSDEAQFPVSQDLLRSDSQGAVEVDVMPVDLASGEDGMLVFEIAMNTHSVDLSLDLAKLATLQADNGVTVEALDWSGGSGHHVEGVLRLPADASDGRSVMDGASRLVLTIRNVDAQERTFEWDLPAAQ